MRNKYSTAHHTSYKSTVRGLVRLRALSNKGLMIWNCSRLVSLGYFLLRTSLLSMEASKDHEHVLSKRPSAKSKPGKMQKSLRE